VGGTPEAEGVRERGEELVPSPCPQPQAALLGCHRRYLRAPELGEVAQTASAPGSHHTAPSARRFTGLLTLPSQQHAILIKKEKKSVSSSSKHAVLIFEWGCKDVT